MLQGRFRVKLGSILTATALLYVCAMPMTASAAEDWGAFDPFALDVMASGNQSVEAFAFSTASAQPLTRISALPVRGLGAVPVRTFTESTLRAPQLRIPTRPSLHDPFRPWNGQ